ncbi:MAG: putative Ig domain-containing protein [Chitinophagales bacterium]
MRKLLFLLVCFTQVCNAQVKDMLYSGPPVFHGAKVVGNYPNTDFLFTVPATGARPITFTAEGLPAGLKLDAATGIITGKVGAKGNYTFKVNAQNAQGKSTEEIRLEVGELLCLTPPMGWNSWNVFTKDIDEKMLIEMADAMVSTGMRDLGYQYINIDDFWHADTRDSLGNPVANPAKFPHGIKYVADYVHAKGLKLGIYSCAGTMTCGRCFGGYSHEEIDAKKYAEWGVDLLKYDYCYAPWTRKPAIERYTAMGTALRNSGRSIVFSVCEWGIRKPWLWAHKTGGSYWRTTPDIFDTWHSGSPWQMSVMEIVRRNQKLAKYAGPGHWNDPDMLIVGNYGKGKATGANGQFKGMSDVEYHSHMALWCMFSAPLLSSCDLRNMNEATYAILMDTTLLRVNQDDLGEQARLVATKKGVRLYSRNLAGNKEALMVFNTTAKEVTVGADYFGHKWALLQERKLQPHEAQVFILNK